MLNAVPNLSSSQEEIFSLEMLSFAVTVNLSASDNLIRYFALFPSVRVTERTRFFPSSAPIVCSAEMRLESAVELTVAE